MGDIPTVPPAAGDPDPDLDILIRFKAQGGNVFLLGIGKKIDGWQIYNAGMELAEIGLVFIRRHAVEFFGRLTGEIQAEQIAVPGKSYRHH